MRCYSTCFFSQNRTTEQKSYSTCYLQSVMVQVPVRTVHTALYENKQFTCTMGFIT